MVVIITNHNVTQPTVDCSDHVLVAVLLKWKLSRSAFAQCCGRFASETWSEWRRCDVAMTNH